MKLLLDENLALSYAKALREMGIDALHVIEVALDQTEDALIIDYARDNEMSIVTFDLDLTRIVALSKEKIPSIVTFRVKQISKDSFIEFFEQHLPIIQANIEKGALITIDDNGIRIKQLPIK